MQRVPKAKVSSSYSARFTVTRESGGGLRLR